MDRKGGPFAFSSPRNGQSNRLASVRRRVYGNSSCVVAIFNLSYRILARTFLIVLQTIEWTFSSTKPFLACKPQSRRAPVLLKVIFKVCRKTISFLDLLAYCRKYFVICLPACRPPSVSDSLDFITCDIFIYLAAALLCLVQHLHHSVSTLFCLAAQVFLEQGHWWREIRMAEQAIKWGTYQRCFHIPTDTNLTRYTSGDCWSRLYT